jgi:membrane protein implicated in regulation of membrane protease activity
MGDNCFVFPPEHKTFLVCSILTWIRDALPRGQHMWMFGLAALMWATWKIRNRICFDKVPLKSVFKIIFSVVSFMHYWAGMHSEDTQRMISIGGKPDGEHGNEVDEKER